MALGFIICYLSYDCYDFVMYGVDRNQTTVENYKEIFGVKVEYIVKLSTQLKIVEQCT